MLMFWDALREAASRRQDKKSNIPSRNDRFSAKKKQKRNFIQKTKKEYLQKKKKKNILKMSKRFISKFCYCSEIWHSIFEFISASDILHLFFIFSYRGRLEHNNPAVSWTYLNFCIFESFSKFRKSNQIFGVEPLKYACSP